MRRHLPLAIHKRWDLSTVLVTSRRDLEKENLLKTPQNFFKRTHFGNIDVHQRIHHFQNNDEVHGVQNQ